MAEYKKNNWVRFLRQYGPTAENHSTYDELVENSARRNGVAPLNFDSGGLLEEIVENFRAEAPRSVILTGTAGDGKTWTCREVWQQLGGSGQTWKAQEKECTLPLPNGLRLVVLKDLSENRSDHLAHLVAMAQAILSERSEVVYLIAANDGQLRQAWENAPRQSRGVEFAARLVEELLVLSRFRAERERLVLYNLSRQDSARLMERVLDALLAHEGWSRCEGCAGKRAEGPRCPIWSNQDRLRQPLLRERLKALLTLCDQSGAHLPVRELLVLASNMLLGHPDGKDDLLRCQDVPEVLRRGRGHLASLYRNAFGENLPDSKREGAGVFDALRRFGIGEETSNRIDSLLVYGRDDAEFRPQFDALFADDVEYGANKAFDDSLDDYLEGRETDLVAPFTEFTVAQRQRLFFTMPRERARELGLWELTVFRFAGDFLERVLEPLTSGDVDAVDAATLGPLVRGLNRVFTGRLSEDQDELWLASSGSYSQARLCRIFEFSVSVEDKPGESVSLRRIDGGPALIVSPAAGVEVVLPLHLVRFEFLMRVSEGALPSNFSRECYEDVLSFKSRLLRSAARRDGQVGREVKLRLLKLQEEGTLQVQPVTIAMEDSR